MRTPPEVIEKNEPSVPPFNQVTDSFAVNVKTAVEFSGIEMEEFAPVADPGPVIVGGVVSSETLSAEAGDALEPLVVEFRAHTR